MGVLLASLSKVVINGCCHINSNVGILRCDFLGIGVGSGGTESCRELVDEECGDLGERRDVTLSLLRLEVHFCLFSYPY